MHSKNMACEMKRSIQSTLFVSRRNRMETFNYELPFNII